MARVSSTQKKTNSKKEKRESRNKDIKTQIVRLRELQHADVQDENTKKEQADIIQKILEENVPLVNSIIFNNYRNFIKSENIDDLRQCGLVGIIEALQPERKYDPEKSRPSTFFYPYIVHEISMQCSGFEQGLSPHYASLIKEVEKAKQQLEEQNKPITNEALAAITGVKINTVRKAELMKVRSQKKNISDMNFFDSIVTEREASPEELTEEKIEEEVFLNAVNRLDSLEKNVLIYKYGLFGFEKLQNASIAKKLDITVTNIRKIQQLAIKHLQNDEELCAYHRNYIEDNDLFDGEISLTPIDLAEQQLNELIEDIYECNSFGQMIIKRNKMQ